MIRHLLVTALIVAFVYVSLLVVIGHPFVVSAEDVKTTGIAQVIEKPQSELEDRSNNKLVEQPITIFGVVKSINFNRAEQDIGKAWNEFLSSKSLQNNVAWGKDNIKVYAYFHDFNADMSKGKLSLGYSGKDLLLNTDAVSTVLPKGNHKSYKYDVATGSAEAWEAAYKYKNLIERHRLDKNGDIVSSDVIVIQ